jgi:hypothetical protein
MRKRKEETLLDSRNAVVGTRITKSMYEALLRLMAVDSHVTVSDYLRDVLRRDLEQKGFLKTEAPTHE